MYVLYILYVRTMYIPCISRTTSCDLGYHSLSYGLRGSIMACALSTNSLSSALSSCDTQLIKSVIKIALLLKKGNLILNATNKTILLLILVYFFTTYTLYLLAINLLLLTLLVLNNKSLVLNTSFLNFLDSNYLASILFTFQ